MAEEITTAPVAAAPEAPTPQAAPAVPDATPDDLVNLLNHEDFQAAPYGQRIAAINQIGQGIVQHLQKDPATDESTASKFSELIGAAYQKAAPPAPQGATGSFFAPIVEKGPAVAAGTSAGIGAGIAASESGPGAVAADLAASSLASAGTQKGIDLIRGPVATRRAQEQLEVNQSAHPWASGFGNAAVVIPSMVNPANWFKAGATTTAGKIGQRMVQSGTAGARAGDISASTQFANGSANLIDIPKEMIHSAATMAPLGFLGPARNVLTAMLGKAPKEAAIAATSEAIYQRVVNGKPLDLSEITEGAVKDVPGFVLLNALGGMFHARAKIDQAAKADDVNAINGVVQSAQPAMPMYQKVRAIVNAYLGKTFAKTTARDREAGELGARWISSKAAAVLAADSFSARVLLDSGIPVEKFGAALAEDNLRSVRDGLLAEGKPGDAAKVETLIGSKDSPLKTEKQYQDFLNDPAVKDAIERHKQLWNDIVDPMYKSAAHIDPSQPLPTRGKQTGARVNLFNEKESLDSVVAGVTPNTKGEIESSLPPDRLGKHISRIAAVGKLAAIDNLEQIGRDRIKQQLKEYPNAALSGDIRKYGEDQFLPAQMLNHLDERISTLERRAEEITTNDNEFGKQLANDLRSELGERNALSREDRLDIAALEHDDPQARYADAQKLYKEASEMRSMYEKVAREFNDSLAGDNEIQSSSPSEEGQPSVTAAHQKAAVAQLSKTSVGRMLLKGASIVQDWQRALAHKDSRSYSADEIERIKRSEGFFDPQTGKVVVIRDNVRPREGETPEDALIRVLRHERTGHQGTRWMLDNDPKFRQQWHKAASNIPQAELDALKALYGHLQNNSDQLIGEWFARKVENLKPGELPDPKSVFGQMWQALKDFLARLLGRETNLDQQVRDLARQIYSRPEAFEGGTGQEGDLETQQSIPPSGNPANRLTNTFRRKSRFARKATGTGRNYNVNYTDMMRNTFASQLEIANKNAFEKRLVESGNAVEDRPGLAIKFADGEDAYKQPFQLARTMVINRDGETFHINKVLYVRKSLAQEYIRAADVGAEEATRFVKYTTGLLNHAALAGLTDGTVHVANLMTALLTRPGTAAGVGADTMLSAFARADIPVTIIRTIAKGFQDNKLQIARLAEIGAMKNQAPHSSWNPLSRWMSEFIRVADKTTRLALDDAFTRMAKDGHVVDTETNRREFVNQVGQYNIRAQGYLRRLARNTGLGPFVTAGTTFNILGLRTLTLRSGAEATSAASSALLGVNVLSKWIGAAVIAGTLNYLFTKDKGGGAMGRPGVPLGRIDTGLNDENGNPLSYPFFDLLGLGRGLRVTGVRGFVESRRKGLSVQDAVDSSRRDIFNSNTSPFFGPIVRAVTVAFTGQQPAIGVPRESNVVPDNESQTKEDFKTALFDANPILKSYVLSKQPGQGWLAAVRNQIPRLALVPSQPEGMMQDYPQIVRRARAAQFMEDVIGRARKMKMEDRIKFINESLNRLDPADRAHANRTLKQRKVFAH